MRKWRHRRGLTTWQAFRHHYTGVGMDEGRFDSALQSCVDLIARYEEMERTKELVHVPRMNLL